MPRPVLVAQGLLVELAGGQARQGVGEVDRARLVELFAQLEFNSWLDEYRDKQPASASHLPLRHETLLTAEQFERWLQKLTAAANFVIDTETSSLDCISAQLVGLAFAVEPGEAAYLPLRHDYPDVPPQLDCDWVLSRLRPLLEDPGHLLAGLPDTQADQAERGVAVEQHHEDRPTRHHGDVYVVLCTLVELTAELFFS